MEKCSYFFIIFFLFSCGEKEITFKVMSYNLRHGLPMTLAREKEDDVINVIKKNLIRQSKVIKFQNPDIVALQEIDEKVSRSGDKKQTEILSKSTDLLGFFYSALNFQGGEYGLSLLSKVPFKKVFSLSLPGGNAEPRIAIIASIDLEDTDIDFLFVNIHFDWIRDPTNRLLQAKALIEYLDKRDLPSLILGDYNAEYNSLTLDLFKKAGFVFVEKEEKKETGKFTFPSDKPFLEIDHMMYRDAQGVKFQAEKISVLNEREVSDHLPIVTKIKLNWNNWGEGHLMRKFPQ